MLTIEETEDFFDELNHYRDKVLSLIKGYDNLEDALIFHQDIITRLEYENNNKESYINSLIEDAESSDNYDNLSVYEVLKEECWEELKEKYNLEQLQALKLI